MQETPLGMSAVKPVFQITNKDQCPKEYQTGKKVHNSRQHIDYIESKNMREYHMSTYYKDILSYQTRAVFVHRFGCLDCYIIQD